MPSELLEVEEARSDIEDKSVTSSLIDVGDLSFKVSGKDVEVAYDGNFFKVGPKKVIAQIREETGVHFRALKEYQDDRELHPMLIKHSLERRKGKEVRIVHSGDTVLDFLPGAQAWMSPLDVFDNTMTIIGKEVQAVESVRWDRKDRTSIRFVMNRAEQPPKRVDDLSHAGIWVRSNGALEVSAYVLRLVCTNGMLRDLEVVANTTMETMQASLLAKVHEAVGRSEKMLKEFVQLDDTVAPNPAPFLTALVRQNNGTGRQLRELMEGLPSLPVNATNFDLVNYVTSLEHSRDDDAFSWLGAAASHSLSHDRACSQCSRRL